ncbi:MAG: membrane-bound lytic murein transglycosylase D [Cyclobacteriaceae bacterium]|jgi:membrane-bound lytic murein transglycosylase D
MNYREEHNLYPDESFLIPEYDTIHVKQYMHLETLADQLSICLDDLLLLNPSIKRGAIPEHTLGFDLKVPIEVMQDLVDRREFLYDTASKVGKEHLAMLAKNTPGSTYGRDKIYYRVRSGDVLGTIARDYHVRVSDIKAWNNLNSNMIRVGQRLSVWVLPSYSSSTKDLYASAQTQSRPKPSPNVVLTPGQKLYRVQNGDTLWDISQKSKVSIEMLKSLNNLRGNTIHPGQQLVLGSD